MAQTHYETLGVAKDAGADVIKSIYRKLAIKYHPDKNPNDKTAADTFQTITLAYQVLMDPVKRKSYDDELAAPKAAARPAAAPGGFGRDRPGFDMAEALRTFMDTMRGDRAFQRSFYAGEPAQAPVGGGPVRGENIQLTVRLSLLEIANGTRKKVSVTHKKRCKSCDGTGDIEKRTKYNACSLCAGKGKVRIADTNKIQRCHGCHGTGSVALDPCISCNGSGVIDGSTELMVTFDEGIAEGNYITIPGMGQTGIRGGTPGDLLIFIEEEPHRLFTRRGYDLETAINVSLATAVLGGSGSVSDLKNQSHMFKIAAGTPSGKMYRIDGLGLPYYKQNNRGNLYVKVQVEIPANLSEKAQKAFQAFVDTVEEESAGKSYVKTGRYHLITLPEENNINRLIAAFNTADILSESKLPIALDFSAVSSFNSGNISRIIAIQRKMSKYNEDLVLTGVHDSVFKVFTDCNLEKVFTFKESTDDLLEEHDDKQIPLDSSVDGPPPPVRQVRGHWLIYGGMDTFEPQIFNQAEVAELFRKKGFSIGLDLRDVKFINSLILGELIRRLKEARKMGGAFFLFAATTEVIMLLQATNLDKLFTMVKNEAELQPVEPGS